MWPVDVKELVAESVDEYEGLNNMLDNIVAKRHKNDNNNNL